MSTERESPAFAAPTAHTALAGMPRHPAPIRLRRCDAPKEAVLPRPRRLSGGRAVLRHLVRLVRMVATWPERRRVIDALSGKSDRELADIGLNRSEIGRVFDPEFVRDRVRREALGPWT